MKILKKGTVIKKLKPITVKIYQVIINTENKKSSKQHY